MTSTFSPKAAVAARVAGFLALLAAGAALLVLFAAAAHAALGTSSSNAKHAVVMHRAPGAAPHLRHQHSGLRRDGGRHGRPDHQLRHRAADYRSGQQRPAQQYGTWSANTQNAGARERDLRRGCKGLVTLTFEATRNSSGRSDHTGLRRR